MAYIYRLAALPAEPQLCAIGELVRTPIRPLEVRKTAQNCISGMQGHSIKGTQIQFFGMQG